MSAFTSALSKLESALDNLVSKEDLRQSLQNVQDDVQEIKDISDSIEDEMNTLKNTVRELDCENVQDDIHVLNTRFDELSADVDSMNRELEEFVRNDTFYELSDNVEELISNLHTITQYKGSTDTAVAVLTARVSELASSLNHNTQSSNVSANAINEAVEPLQNRLAAREAQIEALILVYIEHAQQIALLTAQLNRQQQLLDNLLNRNPSKAVR